MLLRTRVWNTGKFFVIVGALAATYIVFAAASMRLAIRAREVKVPDLTNRTASDATDIGTDLGLTVHVDETRRPDLKIPVGHVLAQDPAPGLTTRWRSRYALSSSSEVASWEVRVSNWLRRKAAVLLA